MYLKKISFKAFKDYLKNPTDPFLEGNIYITDSVAKYFRFVRAPAAKGEHTVEILYGGTQHEYYSKRYMGNKQFSPNASLNFMAYVVDGEMLYSASEALNELFPQIKADAKNVQLLSAAGEKFHLLGIVMMPQEEVCEKWPLCAFFQDGCDHNYDFATWEPGNIPFFMDAIAKAKAITPDNSEVNIDYLQRSRCYEYIYETLGLDSWMLDRNGDVPYESFSLCGVKNEMDLFRYVTRLKVLLDDHREDIMPQPRREEINSVITY